MPEYGFLDHNGNFGALWYETGDDIRVFLPHTSKKILKSSLELWRQHHEYVGSPEDKQNYSPEINAAALVTSQENSYIDKKTLKTLVRPRGHYNPRVWRGIPPKSPLDTGYNGLVRDQSEYHLYMEGIHSAESLLEELTRLFRTIAPAPANDATYGHRVRELLILACTEVEASWRGIYTANCSTTKNSYSTKHYVKLKPLLRLDEWVVRLKNYPGYPELNPFKGWESVEGMTTKSLHWYDDYNAVKHNRENEFHRASFGSLIKAMAAIHVLQVAQWGPELYHRFHGNRYSAFETVSFPEYGPEEQYISVPVGLYTIKKVPYFG
ncbi:hypothetical protein ACQW7T_004331 [Pseudomonas aeruginosa]|nr:hypothetical protein [Pseudomonas aeruginosa]EKW6756112.1 hypothetical protein [Pseudomonas aeruginosa]EKY2865982.1 hypothetical protein [Pseudomonas aeruginosa]ELI2560626.1 hypothetical protein [Pseudomonas aeruginosa]